MSWAHDPERRGAVGKVAREQLASRAREWLAFGMPAEDLAAILRAVADDVATGACRPSCTPDMFRR